MSADQKALARVFLRGQWQWLTPEQIDAEAARLSRCGALSPESKIACHLAKGHKGAHEAIRGVGRISSWASGAES